ncbi:MAG: hypothetical protein V4632_02925 [Pseudomonadota bacterium]
MRTHSSYASQACYGIFFISCLSQVTLILRHLWQTKFQGNLILFQQYVFQVAEKGTLLLVFDSNKRSFKKEVSNHNKDIMTNERLQSLGPLLDRKLRSPLDEAARL